MHCEVSHVSHPQGPVEMLELTSHCCSHTEHLLTLGHSPIQMTGLHFSFYSYICLSSPGEILRQLFWIVTGPLIREIIRHLLEKGLFFTTPPG